MLLKNELSMSGAAVAPTEVMIPAWRGRRGGLGRLEISYTIDGIRHYVDVTLRYPLADAHVVRAAEEDGYAAHEGEREKFERYPAIASEGLAAVQPFGMESFGRFGYEASLLLRSARRRVEERSISRYGTWLSIALHARWMAQLNVALIAGMFDSISACLGAVGVPSAIMDGVDHGPLAWAAVPFLH